MIMMGDRKKAVAAILGPEESESKEHDGPDALHAIAEELIDCVKSGDAAGVAAAFKAAFAHCESEPHEEYEED